MGGKKRLSLGNKEVRDDSGDIIYPPEVINRKAWDEYIALYEWLSDPVNHLFETSDPELVLNLASSRFHINNKIVHLPKAEQKRIIKIHEAVCVKRGYMTKKKIEAVDGYAKQGERRRKLESKLQGNEAIDRMAEIVEMFGRFYSISEVHKVITTDWGVDITTHSLSRFRSNNMPKILELQEKYRREFSDVRLGIKRSRLDELSYLYNTRRQIYDKTTRLDDSRELRAILLDIRREIEGDRVIIDGNMSIDINQTISVHINQEMMNTLGIKSMIIARTAAKLNVSPLMLQYRLSRSYYAKFAGFMKSDINISDEEIPYPSKIIYNFEDLEIKNRDWELKQENALMQDKPLADQDITAVDSFRNALVKKLIELKNTNSRHKATVEAGSELRGIGIEDAVEVNEKSKSKANNNKSKK